MQVQVVSWSEPARGVIYTMELSAFAIPREHDVISFEDHTHVIHHVKWKYERGETGPYLVGVTLYA